MPSVISSLYEFGEFRLDTQNRVLKRGEQAVTLTPKTFELLLLLIQNAGDVVSKDDLMRSVWSDSYVEESNLTQTVFMLRKALGETPEQRYILTIPGRGYRFTLPVRSVSENSTGSTSDSSRFRTAQPSVAGAIPAHSYRVYRWIIAGIAICVVSAAALLAYLRWSERRQLSVASERRMLAVLPFQNLTGDPNQEYFSDGLTEEMIGALGNLDPQHLGIIARTSVMHYKGSQASLDQIGRELGVQYVIEGSVRRDSKKVRITAQLIQTQDQTHLWARQYDRDLKDLLAVQGEIAQEVADEIQSTFAKHRPVAEPPSTFSPQSFEAYDLYLKGQYYLNKRTVPGLQQAINYFQQATIKDPNYARAYAGLADCYALAGGYSGRPQTEFMPEARAAALHALQIDDKLPEAHTALALIVQNYDWDWQTAEKEFRRAIELNPNYATAHHWYAEHLMWRGRFDEALRESERARELDPISLIIAADNGAILFFSRQYDGAIAKWHSVLEMDANFPRAHLVMGAYVEKGMFAEAQADNEKLRPLSPVSYWSWRGYISGRAGQSAQARHALQELLRVKRSQPVDAIYVARAYVGAGDKNQALAWLEKAYVEHSNELVTLKVSPLYDPLRGDPRFQELLNQVGLSN
jgi:TolB-like protein/DNA-binding winged helix-turn-helix (wHTH) protein/Tfp pilus assembly protein PilF